MDDWDAEQQSRTTTASPVRPADMLLGVLILVLVAILLGVALRATWHERSFGGPTGTGATAPGVRTEQTVSAEEAAKILFGGGLHAADPQSMNLPPGQTVVLRNVDTEVRVTPGRPSVGTGACAAGPLLTVELSIQLIRGSAALPLEEFVLLTRDGSVVHAIDACSAGFADAAPKRTVVFAAAQPGRLVYGPDPNDPVAIWQLA